MKPPHDTGLGTLFVTMTALVSPAHHKIGLRPLYPASGGLDTRAWVRRAVNRLLRTLTTWHERSRQRQRLAELDDHLLRDIGITRAQAQAEFDKPFWRA
jgi:uncharacterized protein YjiS (DUF1127 family)